MLYPAELRGPDALNSSVNRSRKRPQGRLPARSDAIFDRMSEDIALADASAKQIHKSIQVFGRCNRERQRCNRHTFVDERLCFFQGRLAVDRRFVALAIMHFA